MKEMTLEVALEIMDSPFSYYPEARLRAKAIVKEHKIKLKDNKKNETTKTN